MCPYSDFDPDRYVRTTAEQKNDTCPDVYLGVSMNQDNCPGWYGGITSIGRENINNDSRLTTEQKEAAIKELDHKAMMYY